MSGLSREFRTCCRKQQNKIQPANKKKQARIFQARKYEVHIFQQAASLFPSWPVSSPEPHASRPSAHSFSAPAGQHLPFPFTSHSGQPVNRQMLFCSFGFPDAKTRGAYLAASKTIVSGLAGQYLPLQILLQPPTRQLIPFRRQPADSLLSYFFTEPNASPRPPAHSFRRQPANISRHHSFHTGPTIFNKPTPFLPAWPADALHPFLPLF